MNSSRTPRCSLQAASARPRNSGPLSTTIASGSPRSVAIRLQHTAHAQPAQRSVDLDGRTFARAIVHDGQHSNHLPCTDAITHEIHRPAFVRPRGGWAGDCPIPADPPSLPNPHGQAFFAIQPVHALVI